jgi:hypothetical protein
VSWCLDGTDYRLYIPGRRPFPATLSVGTAAYKKGSCGSPLYVVGGSPVNCVAVFVDAGYLFAQGSTALTGSKKPRRDVNLNETVSWPN